MKTNHLFSVFLFSGCIISIAYSQQIKIDQTIKGKNIPQINYVFNRISGNINSFYEKLTNLKKHDTGVVRIVHIGDSYIQAGFLTGTIRTDLQEIFGNGLQKLMRLTMLKALLTCIGKLASLVTLKKILYGVSLEKNQAGIIYHSIDVNGARYDQYNSDSLFWKHLPALQADIFIVSLGTNEAQANSFNEIFFLNSTSVFISKLLKASPNATVLLTTPADSYKGQNSNAVFRQLNVVLNNYCFKNNIGMWDLYKTTNGYGSAKNWYRMNLLSKDFVHFTSAGYQLQAKLFFIALMKGYNDYNSND